MKKYVVETYYTCTFKTVHNLNNLDEAELSKIDQRSDGEVEVIDVKLNNRKTKKLGDNGDNKDVKTKNNIPCSVVASHTTNPIKTKNSNKIINLKV